MRVLLTLISLAFLGGCASGPVSPANGLYESHGGFVFPIADYEPGRFQESDTAKIPEAGDWDREQKQARKTFREGHVVFGHFPRRANEPQYEKGDWKGEARYFLISQTEKTLSDLGFEILYKRRDDSFTTGFSTGGGLDIYAVFNDDIGCGEEDQCTVTIKYSGAHLAKNVRTSRSTYGGAQDSDRVMNPKTNNFIRFNQAIQAPFDQRIFYKKLSENMPVGMYVYLNAKPEAYVQINDTEVVAYPYLLNQGKVMLFEEPVSQ